MATNYSSSAMVYDSRTGGLIMTITGLRNHILDSQGAHANPFTAHLYSRLIRAPDLTLNPQACAENSQEYGWDKVQEMSDLIAHKRPNTKVVKASLMPEDFSSVWLEGTISSPGSTARNAFSSYSLLTNDASAFVAAQGRYDVVPRTTFQLLDFAQVLPFDGIKSS